MFTGLIHINLQGVVMMEDESYERAKRDVRRGHAVLTAFYSAVLAVAMVINGSNNTQADTPVPQVQPADTANTAPVIAPE